MKELTRNLQQGRYRAIVEADIKGFFDNLDHQQLIGMLKQRVDDQPLLRLIGKWLRAGVLDTDGKLIQPLTGTPQGGIISHFLDNIIICKICVGLRSSASKKSFSASPYVRWWL